MNREETPLRGGTEVLRAAPEEDGSPSILTPLQRGVVVGYDVDIMRPLVLWIGLGTIPVCVDRSEFAEVSDV